MKDILRAWAEIPGTVHYNVANGLCGKAKGSSPELPGVRAKRAEDYLASLSQADQERVEELRKQRAAERLNPKGRSDKGHPFA